MSLVRRTVARRGPLRGIPANPLLWISALSLLASPAQGQGVPAPSQVTPQNIAPPQNAPPPLTITGPAAAKAPPGAEALRVAVGTVVVDGGYPDMAATTELLVAPYRNKTATIAE